MLSTYNSSPQTLTLNQVLAFDSDAFNRGSATSHTPGSGSFTLNTPGVYQITFNASAAATESIAVGDTSTIIAQLYKNGVAQPNGITSADSVSDTDIVSLGFSTLIEVPYGCPYTGAAVNCSIQNTGIDADYSFGSVTVVKVL